MVSPTKRTWNRREHRDAKKLKKRRTEARRKAKRARTATAKKS